MYSSNIINIHNCITMGIWHIILFYLPNTHVTTNCVVNTWCIWFDQIMFYNIYITFNNSIFFYNIYITFDNSIFVYINQVLTSLLGGFLVVSRYYTIVYILHWNGNVIVCFHIIFWRYGFHQHYFAFCVWMYTYNRSEMISLQHCTLY